MKNQVLSREQMKELIDMGIDVSKASMYISEYGEIISNVKICELGIDWTPTLTIQDILEMLPNAIDWKGKTYRFSVFVNYLGNKMIVYRNSDLWSLECKYFNINGAFDMLKWCKKNKYI